MINVKSLNLIINYPLIIYQNDKVKYSDLLDTITIYYVNECIIYKLPPIKSFQDNKSIPNSEPFFIYRKNSKIGTLYDSINKVSKGMIVNVDSFLLNRASTGLKIDFSNSSWYRFESIGDHNHLLEKYVPHEPSKDPDSIDSAFFYYTDKLKDYDYSFSRKNDSIRNMKMYRIRLLYNSKIFNRRNMYLPKREIFYEIQKRDFVKADSLVIDLYYTYINSVLKTK